MQKVRQGDIYWVNFDPSVGHEYKKERPAVVIQSDEQLRKSNLVTVMPLTSRLRSKHPDDILVAKDSESNLYTDSLVKVHAIMSFDRSRFTAIVGRVSTETMNHIKSYLRKHFGV